MDFADYLNIAPLTDDQVSELKHFCEKNKIKFNVEFYQVMVNIVATKLGYESYRIHIEGSFYAEFAADSLDSIELIMALERCFKLNIPIKEAEKIWNLRTAYKYIINQ